MPIHGQLTPSKSASKFRALQVAERQMIGALILQPDLFATTLSDGRALDEAITALDCVTEPAARLYEMMYQRLADGQSLTIASLLADLADEGEAQLGNFATGALAEVEQMADGSDEELLNILMGAVTSLLKARQEEEFKQSKQEMLADRRDDTNDVQNLLRITRQISEHQQAHPSTARILKPGR